MNASIFLRTRFSAKFVMVLGVVLLFTGITAFAQTLPSPPLPYQSSLMTLGTVTCASSLCHGSIKSWKDSNVLQNEYITWSRLDKHARAYNKLLNAQSQKIAKNLGLKQPAHEAKICLDCHAHNVAADQRGDRFKISDGVTCEACHGPAEKWIRTHVEPDTSHARNIEHGLYPTADATLRAKLCLSCHLGNKDKLVTHRMMAAGHPRMSFELDTFTEIAPKHFVVDNDYETRKGIWVGVKSWAIGQALAVSGTMDILLDDKRGRDGLFPELVLFDCHACHHPMSESRWKPKTVFGTSLSPGLVRLNDGNLLMLRAVAFAIEPARGEAIATQIIKLHKAVAGDGDAKAEALGLKKMALDLIATIANKTLNSATIRGAALRLVDDGLAGYYTDYAAAEQATMAISSVGNFLVKQGSVRNATAFHQRLQKLNSTLASDERYKPAEFEAQLRELRAILAP